MVIKGSYIYNTIEMNYVKIKNGSKRLKHNDVLRQQFATGICSPVVICLESPPLRTIVYNVRNCHVVQWLNGLPIQQCSVTSVCNVGE